MPGHMPPPPPDRRDQAGHHGDPSRHGSAQPPPPGPGQPWQQSPRPGAAHSAPQSQHGPGPTAHQPPAPPPPLQLAKALLILLLVRILVLFVQGPGLQLTYWTLDLAGVNSSMTYMVLGLGVSVLAMLGGGIWIACLALTIVVIVRSRGQLRNGAIVVIAALAISTLFSLDVSGDIGDGLGQALTVLGLALDVIGLIATAVAAYFLSRGLKAASAEGSSRHALF